VQGENGGGFFGPGMTGGEREAEADEE
jgi:hypothetical protein